LLGRLLRRPQFSRTAVINEFGEIGLDHDLIEASEDSWSSCRPDVCAVESAAISQLK
jgi:G3E family GTPase